MSVLAQTRLQQKTKNGCINFGWDYFESAVECSKLTPTKRKRKYDWNAVSVMEPIIDMVAVQSSAVWLFVASWDDNEAAEGVDLSDVLRCVAASGSFTLSRGQW